MLSAVDTLVDFDQSRLTRLSADMPLRYITPKTIPSFRKSKPRIQNNQSGAMAPDDQEQGNLLSKELSS